MRTDEDLEYVFDTDQVAGCGLAFSSDTNIIVGVKAGSDGGYRLEIKPVGLSTSNWSLGSQGEIRPLITVSDYDEINADEWSHRFKRSLHLQRYVCCVCKQRICNLLRMRAV